VVKLDDDGAIALPLADPASTSFAIIEPAFQPEALRDFSETDAEGD
jgi:rod shape-determining protein MreC